VYCTRLIRPGKISPLLAWGIAVIIIILSGVGYRILASRLELIIKTPINLPTPLSAFPADIGGWKGEDIEIPQNIQRKAGNDDYVNRLYKNKVTNQWVMLYIAYTARPRTMMGHHPDICYVYSGWVKDNSDRRDFVSERGRQVPCQIFNFHTPEPYYQQTVVLDYYIINGEFTGDDSPFISGLGWRTPNIHGDPARYVAQVQISSISEHAVLSAAKDFTDLILDFFPDINGNVRTTGHINSARDIRK